jgi:NDP-sugar pyrophosphorylase family protein
MKIIIPMSGQGSRFKAVGYPDPKPLIVVDGKPIIAHVLDMFPEATDITFICNKEHLATTPMRSILKSLRPDARILPIPSHTRGPVHAVTAVYPYPTEDEDVLVSYCDFTQVWDFPAFLEAVAKERPGGAVPAYTGFHPHLLRDNVYAGIRTDTAGTMLEIQEKHCFTPRLEDCHHSSGLYYFGSGAILKQYSDELLASNQTINGEYYTSMIFPLMLRDGLRVTVPPISRFMQWGTPEDLEAYEAWSRLIHTELGRPKAPTAIPPEREQLIRIPYEPGSSAYDLAHTYWTAHFASL